MQTRRLVLAFLVIFPMVFGLVLTPDVYSNTSPQDNDTTDLPDLINYQDYDVGKKNAFSLSQDDAEGIINPVQVKESGFQETDAVKARTDTGTNTIQNITINEGNNWFANYTSIEVSNIKRLYGINGTFEEGVEPWTNYTIDGGSNTQIADYDSDGEYIICQNIGNYKWASQHTWEHSAGSEVGWEQTVYNPEGKLIFDLKFDYRYATGPIDPEGDNGFGGDIGVFYQVDNGVTYDAWYFPMELYVDSRDAWNSLTNDFTLPAAWSEFSVVVGLWIASDVTLNNVTDYDDDPLGLPDGIEHARNLTLYIDNVEFTGREVPTFERVDLTFHAGVFSEAITGSGVGVASISNPDYWTANPLEIQITSNTTVVFTYSVITLFHRYTNSSWTTNPNEHGVAYTVTSGQNPDLSFYTYVTSSPNYYDSTIDILYPNDWVNTTIWDPLLNNITDSCFISPGKVHVPTSELSRSGWWKINLNGLNYAKNVSVQIFDQSIADWSVNSLFRPGNDTRVQLGIGTVDVTPLGGGPVNVSWFLSDETLWAMDSISTMVGGAVTSSTWTFGSTNTTAGEWSIDVIWTNGTEIAFESVTFDLYHSASIVATYPIIEANYGLTISNLITYRDSDTNEYLLDDSVNIEANWSSGIISFAQNYAKNWWEADFDTLLIGGGQFLVVVTASRPYFDNVSIQFTVISLYETTLEILNAGSIPIENGLNEIFTAQIDFEFLNGTGIPGALPVIDYTGPGGGLTWQNFADNNNGHYSVDIVCDISATYEVRITLSKPYHYNTTDSFTLIIGKTGSELELLNGTADIVLFGDSYRLLVEYRNSTGAGLSGADLQVLTVTPSTGLVHTNFSHVIDGYYEITLTPTSAGTFSIVISAGILNHETQYATFTITASGIPTVLSSMPSIASIAVDQNFTVQLRFQDESLNPIDSAYLVVVNPPSGVVISNVTPIGGGLYNFTITPLGLGSFDLLFRASADNYQSSSAAFTLSATEVPTTLSFEGDVSSTNVEYQDPYQLIVYYYRSDTPVPINIVGADLMVLVQDPGLVIDIIEYVAYYMVTIRGESIGSWSLTISANKTNHHLATKQFLFTVEKVPVSVQVLHGLQGPEGFVATLMVNITERDTGDPVIGATVFYDIRASDGTPYGDRVSMDESSPGIYVASLDMPPADGIFYIEISCEALFYGLEEPLIMQLLPGRDVVTMLYMSLKQYYLIYLGVGTLAGGLVYRRSARKRRIGQNKVTLAIKRRFDDVRSLLGVIVLHKDSGLPVYSKILREGLEETVISAFITAITSFRGEFDIESSSEEWGLIPISDIVRVISTNKLVCAFITTGNPSAEQRERMIRFAKTVAFIFDETMDDVPIVVLDRHTTMQFNSLFDDLLDGALLRTYKLDDEKKYPTASCADERIARKHGEEFKLEELASEIASCGLEEGRVYQAIMRALDNHFLVTTDESPYATEIIRASGTVEEEG